MKRACLVLALGACAAEPIEYTGTPRRLVVDSFTLPTTSTIAREHGFDLDDDGEIDNQLGMVISVLAGVNDVTTYDEDIVAAGAIASSVELLADDYKNDETVALRYLGVDGAPVTLIGGRVENGAFITDHEGAATIHLPVLVDADPITLRLRRMHVVLVPDGADGYTALIGGVVAASEVRAAAVVSIEQMIYTRPEDHISFFRSVDAIPHDFVLTRGDLESSELLTSLLAPDITRDTTEPMLSLGFRAHLKACAEGACIAAPPVNTCFDRVADAGETDVDCGGPCEPCAGGLSCETASDCQSNACTGGTCALPTCSDGVHDGFETDVDCGGPCAGCAVSQVCWSNSDCASRECGPPCTGELCSDAGLDTCR